MVPVSARWYALGACLAAIVLACSPEATRQRDGGAGADPGNKNLVMREATDPQTSDTSIWPGLAPAPVERLEKGTLPPPKGVVIPSRDRVQPYPGNRR